MTLVTRSLPRVLPWAATLACLWPTAALAQTPTAALGGWNLSEQRTVVAAGLMGSGPDGGFDGQLPLSASDMQGVLRALAAHPGTVRLTAWNDLTVSGFDAAMVDALGLGSIAAHVQAVAAGVGLNPPRYFGTEVVARQLGLRDDHPAAQDAIELYPTDVITRAEAAHSLARIASQGAWAVSATGTLLASFSLPAYSAAQLAPLSVAVSKIGMPYVWGGVSDTATTTQAHGGYDCSGLIWRTFKLSGNPAGAAIRGRTAARMAGEIPRAVRVPLAAVAPGDLLFFGDAGFAGSATEATITHAAIALSAQWAIESSGQGVNVAPLTSGWLETSFAWGRRVLSATVTPIPARPAVAPAPARSRHARHRARGRSPARRITARPSTPPAAVPAPVGVTGGLSAGGSSPATAGPTGGAGASS